MLRRNNLNEDVFFRGGPSIHVTKRNQSIPHSYRLHKQRIDSTPELSAERIASIRDWGLGDETRLKSREGTSGFRSTAGNKPKKVRIGTATEVGDQVNS